MLRNRRFLHLMHQLALIGVLLMAMAPVISRWVQVSQHNSALMQLTALCTAQGLQLVDLGTVSAAKTPGGHAPPMAMDQAHVSHGDAAGDLPSDHAGMVCDYCLLAAQLLAFVIALLSLALLWAASLSPAVYRAPARVSAIWPAHAARGPPMVLVV
ncbi:DUF2946 domain-containing protein [Xanthomonas gardneri]|uniref:DUF2946 domain-containing protein n=2 Tax=Xanthomonas hortorum TaxID=56454 RepID=A0A6V7ES93_9XANT|nr:DUF2946 family protein [Xanthomonas hortorum]EGD19972.1 hypothetical protein XGA_1367 [Xanthomonas hortorum ATCC 19865]PPU48562.1 DUF2946 domain-containing protein [Xanthomonas hortorum pv. cynarae]CAH2709979.1 DUF2946 domain-containing protein [Xanthomonas campestris pv. nigromaculans]APP79234.1 hypothetical protein BJD10_05580 [Xanthomonas hortorum pv. gardneri]KLA92885.1 hypothetical protein SM19410_21035 [Xanthomonas hortorum pv. gardneri]